jgi:hypothetical protein
VGAPDDGAVHPVRPGADRAAQPGRAERQPRREAVRQFGLIVAGQQGTQLVPVRRIRVIR